MRRGKGLVQIQMHDIKAHIPGPCHPHHRIQVRSVVIAQSPRFMDNPGDFQNVFVKQPYGIGIRQHKARRILSHSRGKLFQVYAAFRGGRDVHHFVACHNRTGRIGSMGGIRHNDFGPLPVPSAFVKGPYEKQPRELPVGARCRLKGHGIHSGYFTKNLFRIPQHMQAALDGFLRLQRMNPGEAGQGSRFIIHFGIVFHGAGS